MDQPCLLVSLLYPYGIHMGIPTGENHIPILNPIPWVWGSVWGYQCGYPYGYPNMDPHMDIWIPIPTATLRRH